MFPIGDDNTGRISTPYITYLLIAINVLVFVFLQGLGTNDQFTYAFSTVPEEIRTGVDIARPIHVEVGDQQATISLQPTPVSVYLTLLVSIFMHGSLMHLLGNMLFLWIFGDNVEDDLSPVRYLGFYLTTGIIASLAHIVSTFTLGDNPFIPSLGASGAISGVMGGYLVLHPHRRVRVIMLRTLTEVPGYVAVGLWFVFQLISAFGVIGQGAQSSGGVAFMAHIGGFIAGVVLVKVFMIKRRAAGLVLLAMFTGTGVQAAGQNRRADQPVFTVGSANASRGQTATGVIEVPAGSDVALSIPVAVAHGAKSGPVLSLLAGAHGTEYASIIALEQLITAIDASQLSGTVIIVPLLNVPSFTKVVPHLNPVDGKNMNRMYPGRMEGTQTDRASYQITRQVVEPADHLIDFHGGDIDESLRPYSYWNKTGRAVQDAISRGMVLAFGLDHIVISTGRPSDPAASIYLENTATTRGKPSITVEAGHAGTVDPDDVAVLVKGSLAVMRHLKMLPGTATGVDNPVWIDHLADVSSERTGIFHPLVKRGSYVSAGMKVGYVTDYVGKTIFEARAKEAGVLLYLRAVPSISKGETIASVGVVGKAP